MEGPLSSPLDERLPEPHGGKRETQETQRNTALLSCFLAFSRIFPFSSCFLAGSCFSCFLVSPFLDVPGSGCVFVLCDLPQKKNWSSVTHPLARHSPTHVPQTAVGWWSWTLAPPPISTSHLAPLRLGSLLYGVVARGAVVSERGECSCRRRWAAHGHTRRRRRRVV